jgi:hypothetical protein
MYPKQCRPVVRPQLVRNFEDKAYSIDHGAPPYFTILGEIDWPDQPQNFSYPVPCRDWCALFGGASRIACLKACGA